MSQPTILDELDQFLQEGKPSSNGKKPQVQYVAEQKPVYVNINRNIFGDPSLTENRQLAEADVNNGIKRQDWTHDPRTPDLPGSKEDLMKGERILDSVEKQFYNFENEKWENQIQSAIEDNVPAVILIGRTGVGKTTMIEEAAGKEGLKVKTFNVPNMDPFLHLVGVPYVKTIKNAQGVETQQVVRPDAPASEEVTLEFVRKNDLEDADIIFLDELNRVDQQTQNQLFELVNTRSVNGVALPKLRSIWAAINPVGAPGEEGGYAVQSLEKAFAGRFWIVINVEAKPKIHHYAGRDCIGESVARTCLYWWYTDIKDKVVEHEGRYIRLDEIVSPRVLFYLMSRIQRMQNNLMSPRPGKRYNMRRWNDDFDALIYHNQLNQESVGLPLPFPQLKAALLGEQMMALSSLRNDSEDIEVRKQEAASVDKGTRMAEMLVNAVRGDLSQTVRGGAPQVPITDIGDFSQVICAMHRDVAAILVVNRMDIAGYLYTKNRKNQQEREALAAKKGNPNDPIATPLTQGEVDIYKRSKPQIDAVIEDLQRVAAQKQQTPGRAPAPAGGAPAAGGSTTPPAPGRAVPGTGKRITPTP